MPRKETECYHCGYLVRWNPETLEGPQIFYDEGRCPSCEQSFEDRAPVSARRGKSRR